MSGRATESDATDPSPLPRDLNKRGLCHGLGSAHHGRVSAPILSVWRKSAETGESPRARLRPSERLGEVAALTVFTEQVGPEP